MSTVAPDMGSTQVQDQVGTVLFNKGRRELLALFFTHSEETFYFRQVVRLLGMGQGVVQRELSRLSEAAVLTRTRLGSQVHYQANRQSPVFHELKSLMIKTAGVAEVLRAGLAPLAERIRVAFVFGSFARGQEGGNSDLDVMVIGSVSFADVVRALQLAQKKTGREVNPVVFALDDYLNKVRARDRFLNSVLNARKIFLVGEENELKRLG